MKHQREIKVGLLAVVALFVLYFGFNFLKGVNIFSTTRTYVGVYDNLNGLVEQAPVYIKGYKVGLVDEIVYDFSQEKPFAVYFSINDDIRLPKGTQLALIQDGLLGGSALQLNLPTCATDEFIEFGDTIPSMVVPGLVDGLQEQLIGQLSSAIAQVDTLVAVVNSQLSGDHLKNTLAKIDNITTDLEVTSSSLKRIMQTNAPTLVSDAQVAVANFRGVSENLKGVDLRQTIDKVDASVDNIKAFTEKINSPNSTLGLLLNDKALYTNLNTTVKDADNLIVDIKENPKRYINVSVFGKKE